MSDSRSEYDFPIGWTTEFIVMYKWEKVLLMKNRRDYKKMAIRNAVLERMVSKMKAVEPNADKEKVGSFIQFLRFQFYRELKFVKNNKKYTPKCIF